MYSCSKDLFAFPCCFDPLDSKAYMDPLLVGLVSVFVVTAIIISLLIFLKFRRRNERPEFRRLQDLPMVSLLCHVLPMVTNPQKLLKVKYSFAS